MPSTWNKIENMPPVAVLPTWNENKQLSLRWVQTTTRTKGFKKLHFQQLCIRHLIWRLAQMLVNLESVFLSCDWQRCHVICNVSFWFDGTLHSGTGLQCHKHIHVTCNYKYFHTCDCWNGTCSQFNILYSDCTFTDISLQYTHFLIIEFMWFTLSTNKKKSLFSAFLVVELVSSLS